MKLNKIALAVLATVATAASAGVTVSPLLLGYQYNDKAQEKQRLAFPINADKTQGGVALDNNLWVGAALGVELTPSSQIQVEYGVSNTDGKVSPNDAKAYDVEQQTISGNLIVGSSYNPNTKLKPYVLVGAGQQKTKVEDPKDKSKKIPEAKDTIGNIGLGARYLINDALALRGEVRGVHNFDNKFWQGLATAGLEVTLGGRLAPAPVVIPVVQPAPVVAKPAAPVPLEDTKEDVRVDVDADGVLDHLDACVGAPGSQMNLVVDARGCPQKVNVNKPLNIAPRVFFDRDKSEIKAQYRDEVAKVALAMREFPNATAVVEGHASKDSNRSSAKYNQRLSEARANAVKSMLVTQFGIAPSRLSAVGYGFSQPIEPNSNDTEAGRVLNRRVVVKTTGNKTTTVEQTKDMVIR